MLPVCSNNIWLIRQHPECSFYSAIININIRYHEKQYYYYNCCFYYHYYYYLFICVCSPRWLGGLQVPSIKSRPRHNNPYVSSAIKLLPSVAGTSSSNGLMRPLLCIACSTIRYVVCYVTWLQCLYAMSCSTLCIVQRLQLYIPYNIRVYKSRHEKICTASNWGGTMNFYNISQVPINRPTDTV